MNITKFCADVEPHGGRYSLTTPWVKDGWRYATDQRITVREKTDAPDDRPGYPSVPELFAELHAGDIARRPLIPPLDGNVTTWEEPACMIGDEPNAACMLWGKGCPHESEYECTNRVKGTTPATQYIASYKWDGRYIELIHKELPGATYALDMGGFMHFYCDGIEGVLARLK